MTREVMENAPKDSKSHFYTICKYATEIKICLVHTGTSY